VSNRTPQVLEGSIRPRRWICNGVHRRPAEVRALLVPNLFQLFGDVVIMRLSIHWASRRPMVWALSLCAS
jgi:hypothetical protein